MPDQTPHGMYADTAFLQKRTAPALQAEDAFMEAHGTAGPVAIYRSVVAISGALAWVLRISRRPLFRRQSRTDVRPGKSAAKA